MVTYEQVSLVCEKFRKFHLQGEAFYPEPDEVRLTYLALVAAKAQLKEGESERLNGFVKEIDNEK